MVSRKSTPLDDFSLKNHRCSVDLRLKKLGMVPFFADLSEPELIEVNNAFSAAHYTVDQTIYYQDDSATMLRVVVHGAVKLVHQTLEGKEVLLDMLKPGEYFGNLSALDDTYSETARTQTDVCILTIRMRDFRSLLDQYSSIAIAVLDVTSRRLQSLQQKIQQLTTLPVKKRIAHILVTLGNKFGEKHPRGLLIQLPLSRKDLADMAGTSAETASRVMSQFQEDDLITSGRQWVAINDKPKLLRISSED